MLDVSGLLRGETRQVDFDESVEIDSRDFDVTFPRLPKISGKVVNMSGYVEFSADISVLYETVCSRCLKSLSFETALKIQAPVAESLENMDNEEYIIPQPFDPRVGPAVAAAVAEAARKTGVARI